MKRKRGTAAKMYSDRVPVTTRRGIIYKYAFPDVSKPNTNPTVAMPKASGKPANKTKRLKIIRTVVHSGLMRSSLKDDVKRSDKFHYPLKKKQQKSESD